MNIYQLQTNVKAASLLVVWGNFSKGRQDEFSRSVQFSVMESIFIASFALGCSAMLLLRLVVFTDDVPYLIYIVLTVDKRWFWII